MKITAVSALLLTATVSLVSAAPDDKETTERVGYTDKAQRSRPKADSDGWIELATPTPASHGREYFIIDPETRPLTQLRISAAAGRLTVRGVKIEFGNHKTRYVQLDKVIDAKHPAYVDLRGTQRVEHVTVTTEGSTRATYALHGEPANTGVARR
jgi:hypothetical protein